LILANKSDEAFALAQSHNLMSQFTSILGEGIPPEDSTKVAQYYERTQNYGLAGR
jgi:hypothetical protein